MSGRPYVWSVLGLYAGLRAGEACRARQEHLTATGYGKALWVAGKGGKEALIPAHPRGGSVPVPDPSGADR